VRTVQNLPSFVELRNSSRQHPLQERNTVEELKRTSYAIYKRSPYRHKRMALHRSNKVSLEVTGDYALRAKKKKNIEGVTRTMEHGESLC